MKDQVGTQRKASTELSKGVSTSTPYRPSTGEPRLVSQQHIASRMSTRRQSELSEASSNMSVPSKSPLRVWSAPALPPSELSSSSSATAATALGAQAAGGSGSEADSALVERESLFIPQGLRRPLQPLRPETPATLNVFEGSTRLSFVEENTAETRSASKGFSAASMSSLFAPTAESAAQGPGISHVTFSDQVSLLNFSEEIMQQLEIAAAVVENMRAQARKDAGVFSPAHMPRVTSKLFNLMNDRSHRESFSSSCTPSRSASKMSVPASPRSQAAAQSQAVTPRDKNRLSVPATAAMSAVPSVSSAAWTPRSERSMSRRGSHHRGSVAAASEAGGRPMSASWSVASRAETDHSGQYDNLKKLTGGAALPTRSSGSDHASLNKRINDASEALIRGSKYVNIDPGVNAAERWRSAFNHFESSERKEINRDDLPTIVKHLGHTLIPDEVVEDIAKKVSVYSTFNFKEFAAFMKLYEEREQMAYIAIFKSMDQDGSGDISKTELMQFMRSLGFTPLQHMIQEAMELFDKDGNGTLDFEEVAQVIRYYQLFEGFTKAEVAHLEVVFNEYARHDGSTDTTAKLSMDNLTEALIEMFGAANKEMASKLPEILTDESQQFLASRTTNSGAQQDSSAWLGAKRRGSGSYAQQDPLDGGPVMLTFEDFLRAARRLREFEIESFRPLFANYDPDDSGSIDLSELKELLRTMGLTPLQKVLKKVIAQVDNDGNEELCFDEFVSLMGLLRRTEGFSDEEVHVFEDVFERFDEDKSGEIDALEIINVLRSMGHDPTLEETHHLIAQCDANESGGLDFREFLHLMRMWREEELASLRAVFGRLCDVTLKKMRVKTGTILDAMVDIGYSPEKDDIMYIMDQIMTDLEIHDGKEYCDFDTFVEVADKTRQRCAEKRARYAGLSHSQVVEYRTLFESYCLHDADEVSAQALSDLMGNVGVELRTREQQQEMVTKIEAAKAAAKRSGVPEHELESKDGCISWWLFVQLLGWLNDERNQANFQHENEIIKKLEFSTGEVSGFRSVFEEWARLEFHRNQSKFVKGRRHITHFGVMQARTPSVRSSARESASRRPGHGSAPAKGQVAIRRVMLGAEGIVLGFQKSMNIILKPRQRQELDVKMDELAETDGEATSEESGAPRIAFSGFLQLLRWMLDRNFAGVADIKPK
eukprot:CAMPEP_0178382308 /NCGR_PEP_ID=MMETSP0689_2-20121128/6427_1 /TAXON_ID=160604 /ORGANISM="Amphidinium massartii, Strain CS-259" /LENGTH=1166 /DNA_ID=CAMNT_0020002509 /DNA_START=59 /DNA_END=3559 /DNA_ORIENTATION=-